MGVVIICYEILISYTYIIYILYFSKTKKTIYSMYNYKKPEKLKEKVGDICGCVWK